MATGIANPVHMSVPGVAWMSIGGLWTGIDEGQEGYVLTSNGNNVLPSFQPPSDFLASYTPVNFSMSPYTVLSTDEFLGVDTSGGSVVLKFPDSALSKRPFTAKDITGNGATNSIQITSVSGSVLFDDATSKFIDSNFGSMSILGNNTKYLVY